MNNKDLGICPECGSGDMHWCKVSKRKHCNECNWWDTHNYEGFRKNESVQKMEKQVDKPLEGNLQELYEGALVRINVLEEDYKWKPYNYQTLEGIPPDYAWRNFEGQEYYMKLPVLDIKVY